MTLILAEQLNLGIQNINLQGPGSKLNLLWRLLQAWHRTLEARVTSFVIF